MDEYTIIKCPNCLLKNKTRTLGYLYTGSMQIQTAVGYGRREHTTLIGTAFDIVCSTCKQMILTRDREVIYVFPIMSGTIA